MKTTYATKLSYTLLEQIGGNTLKRVWFYFVSSCGLRKYSMEFSRLNSSKEFKSNFGGKTIALVIVTLLSIHFHRLVVLKGMGFRVSQMLVRNLKQYLFYCLKLRSKTCSRLYVSLDEIRFGTLGPFF